MFRKYLALLTFLVPTSAAALPLPAPAPAQDSVAFTRNHTQEVVASALSITDVENAIAVLQAWLDQWPNPEVQLALDRLAEIARQCVTVAEPPYLGLVGLLGLAIYGNIRRLGA